MFCFSVCPPCLPSLLYVYLSLIHGGCGFTHLISFSMSLKVTANCSRRLYPSSAHLRSVTSSSLETLLADRCGSSCQPICLPHCGSCCLPVYQRIPLSLVLAFGHLPPGLSSSTPIRGISNFLCFCVCFWALSLFVHKTEQSDHRCEPNRHKNTSPRHPRRFRRTP